MGRRRVGLVFGVWVFLLLVAVLNVPLVRGSGTIYIRADGGVDPPTAPIIRDGNVYTFAANIYDSIVIEKDNIVVDGAGYTVQGTANETGIELSGRHSVTIENMKIKAFWPGIVLYQSSNNTISGNNITANNGYGIWLEESSDNTISGNNITANIWYGIRLSGSSNYNTISGNNITANIWYGIVLYGSSNNRIYHNNFINNTDQADLRYSVNVWDDGYPSGGNYWSNYTGVDEKSGPNQDQPGRDEIGDVFYAIDENNTDRYPLMSLWPPADKTPPVTIISLNGVLGDNDWFRSDVVVTLSATDDTEVGKTEYGFDNVTWTTYTTPFFIINEGSTIVYYKSTDRARNPETIKTKAIRIDKSTPSASAGLDQIVNVGTAVTFNGSGSTDNIGIVNYEWDSGDGATRIGKTTTYTYANPGTYTVTLTVKDAAGNTATDTITITVRSGEAPPPPPPPQPSAEVFPNWVIGATIVAIGIAVAATLLFKKRK